MKYEKYALSFYLDHTPTPASASKEKKANVTNFMLKQSITPVFTRIQNTHSQVWPSFFLCHRRRWQEILTQVYLNKKTEMYLGFISYHLNLLKTFK